MSIKLLNELNQCYLSAVTFHRNCADIFWYIYLPGYAMLHEHQHQSESLTQRRIKRYITSTYHIYEQDKPSQEVTLAHQLLSGRNRKDLKHEDVRKIVQDVWLDYEIWEETALNKYQKIASELCMQGDVSAFNFVGDIIKDVKKELVYVTDKVIELCAISWDMSQIVSEQNDYAERYEYLIKSLLVKSMTGHHFNSFTDIDSKVSLLDKNE